MASAKPPVRSRASRGQGQIGLRRRLRQIRCVLMDVDGVLTDGKLHFSGDGQEFKTFDVQDGHGIAMAQRAGLTIGFVSGRISQATLRRAEDLGVKIVRQKPTNKMELVDEIKAEHGFRDEEICFIGDELVDLPVLRRAGLAVAVPNATAEVKRAAHVVTRRAGGDGAVREVLELILKAQARWQGVIAKYLMAALVGWIGLGAIGLANEAGVGVIEQFEVPERDDNGNLRWIVAGDQARIRADGLLAVSNLRASFYRSNEVAMVFSSPSCLLDQAHKRATTDSPIEIKRRDLVITGVGAEWDGQQSLFLIRQNVRVILEGAPAMQEESKSP